MNPFLIGAQRTAAPALQAGGGWLGVPLDIDRDLRGRIILLWFFSASSTDTALMAEELRGLQRRFADVLTVIGVHVPRFPRECRPATLRDAVGRLRLAHPVLDDHELVNWDALALRLTPSLVLLDSRGRIAGDGEGSGHEAALACAIAALVEEGDRERTLIRDAAASDGLLDGDLDLSPLAGDGELAFPSGAAAAITGGVLQRLVIADTGHDRVLLCAPDGQLLQTLTGFYQPHGLAFEHEQSLLVCETGCDRVWRVDLGSGIRTLVTDRVTAPTNVVCWHGMVVVAGASQHVLIGVTADGRTELLAGDGSEGLQDGAAAADARLAQPRGLAVTPADELAFVDAGSSALRILDRPGGTVRTLAGRAVGASGEHDGERDVARMQYPLGLAADGETLYVADTYNGRIRGWCDGRLTTVPLGCFAEPAALATLPGNRLLVVDRARHSAAILALDDQRVEDWDVGRVGAETPADLVVPTAMLADGGELLITVDVDLDGDGLDEQSSRPPVSVRVTAAAEWLLGEEREWQADELPVAVAVPVRHGAGRLVIEVRATCGDGDGGAMRERRAAHPVDVVVT